MRNLIAVVLALSLSTAAGLSLAAEAPPAAPAEKAVQDGSTSDERELLLEILKELRGIRGELRSLQRPAVPTMPTPRPLPSSIPLGSGEVLGRGDAKVAIVEFSDYQCPFCKRYHDQTYGELVTAYVDPGRVRYEFRDYPLASLHPQARSAALAARCAAEQGAFWKMHEALFKAQSSLGPELYPRLAKDLGLDGERFQKCLAEPAQEKALSEEMAAAEGLGVRGTPHFFLGLVKGGSLVSIRALSGAQPLTSFRAALDGLLATSSGSSASPSPEARR